MEDTLRLTETMINAGMSRHGGWSLKQLAYLGTTWENNRGWKRRLIGKTVAKADYMRFLELKDQHFQRRRKRSRSAISRVSAPSKIQKPLFRLSPPDAADYKLMLQHMSEIRHGEGDRGSRSEEP